MSELKHNVRYLKDLMDANAEMKIFLGHMFWKEATACIWHSYDSQACETYCNHEEVSKEIYQQEICPDCPYYEKVKMMDNTVIRKVKVLQGMAKTIAEESGLEPNDLVIVTVSLEKVIGDPVSYLLAQVIEE